jgi:RimJ/RimL family protein N-acetyltransferase
MSDPKSETPDRQESPLNARSYSAIDVLSDGRRIVIRALRPEDQNDLIAAVGRSSAQSLYRRFFAPRRAFTEKETSFFVNVDFVKHVALIAVDEENGQHEIAGGGRYVVGPPGRAELAFMVVDRYQGRGIGTALLRHLVAIATETGLCELTADVLSDNLPMLKILERGGFRAVASRERGTKQLALLLV